MIEFMYFQVTLTAEWHRKRQEQNRGQLGSHSTSYDKKGICLHSSHFSRRPLPNQPRIWKLREPLASEWKVMGSCRKNSHGVATIYSNTLAHTFKNQTITVIFKKNNFCFLTSKMLKSIWNCQKRTFFLRLWVEHSSVLCDPNTLEAEVQGPGAQN